MDNNQQGEQIDVAIVLRKMQDRLSEALLQVSVLEARLEQRDQINAARNSESSAQTSQEGFATVSD